MKNYAALAICVALGMPVAASAEPITIVSWNVNLTSLEGIHARGEEFEQLYTDLQPDILVLTELNGIHSAQAIAEEMGWETPTIVVSDLARRRGGDFNMLEMGVITDLPLERIVELDTRLDGNLPIVARGSVLDSSISVSEELLTSSGISRINPTAGTDRGSMRVDFANGLSIFPVHLKSNRNNMCSAASGIERGYEELGLPIPADITALLDNGGSIFTPGHLDNAQKRERVIAAIKLAADTAVQEDRHVIITGDFNTSLEPGKAGVSLADECELGPISCRRVAFDAEACVGNDGFDDTLGILEVPLVGDMSISFELVSAEFDRTYKEDGNSFADLAIDHFAVSRSLSEHVSGERVADELYGSDHYPIVMQVMLD